MPEFTWDPAHYLSYADERGRPFFDLLGRVDAVDPRRVVDLGCGAGNLTVALAERWPAAEVIGLDSSAEMIARAPADGRVRFEVGDLREWAERQGKFDVLMTNAALQWVPGHLNLLPRLVARLAPKGWFACQVPGNFGQPSHTIRAELAADPRYAPYLAGVEAPSSHDPADYHDALAPLGLAVDAWETTYLHVLHGPDAVFEWVSATGARPTLQALPDGLREEFAAEYRRRLRAAYPERNSRVLLPFRRVFVVAHNR